MTFVKAKLKDGFYTGIVTGILLKHPNPKSSEEKFRYFYNVRIFTHENNLLVKKFTTLEEAEAYYKHIVIYFDAGKTIHWEVDDDDM